MNKIIDIIKTSRSALVTRLDLEIPSTGDSAEQYRGCAPVWALN